MSDYKYIDPPKDKKIIWLRTIRDAWHRSKIDWGTMIPKDSITWVDEKDIYVEDEGIYLCENNRNSSNYRKEDFEIISGPDDKKEVLLTTIL